MLPHGAASTSRAPSSARRTCLASTTRTIYPTVRSTAYFQSRGMNLVRVGFAGNTCGGS